MNEDKHCRPILFHTNGPNAGDQEPFPMGSNIRSRPCKLLSRALTVRPYINYKNHTISIPVFILLNFLVSFNLQFNSIRSSPLFFIYFLCFPILSVKPKKEPFPMGSNIQSRPGKLLSRALTVRPYINYKNHTISIPVFILLKFLVSFNLQFNSIRSSTLFFIYFLCFPIISIKPKKVKPHSIFLLMLGTYHRVVYYSKLLVSILEEFLRWQGSFSRPERNLKGNYTITPHTICKANHIGGTIVY
ncbi:unnamed protein product, partial [Vitis vinifera]